MHLKWIDFFFSLNHAEHKLPSNDFDNQATCVLRCFNFRHSYLKNSVYFFFFCEVGVGNIQVLQKLQLSFWYTLEVTSSSQLTLRWPILNSYFDPDERLILLKLPILYIYYIASCF